MKKMLSLLISLAMLASMLTLCAVNSYAAEAVFVEWSGKTDTAWFNVSAPETNYTIDTPEKLAGLAEIVNSQAIKEPGYAQGITFYITVNMDLKGIEWTPIGNMNAAAFAGTLVGALGGIEGEMITIRNLSITTPANTNMGLVGTQGAGGIKHIKLEGAQINTDKNTAGSFVGYSKFSECVYENLISDASITTTAAKWAGGIVAYSSNPKIIFKNCVYTGDITSWGDTQNVGGLCGQITQNAEISNVYISSDIANYSGSAKYTGGVVGNLGSNNIVYTVDFTDVQFDGTMRSSATQGGSFLGRLNAAPEGAAVTFTNCLNTGLSWQNYSPATMAMSWIGLAANYNLTMKVTFTNCYTMSDVQLLSRADYKAGENPSIFTVNIDGVEQKVTVAENTSLSGYKANSASFENIAGDNAKTYLKGFNFTDMWAAREGKNPVLKYALAYADETHATADYSWFSSEKEEGYGLITENQVLGLAEVLKVVTFAPNQITIDSSLHAYAKTVLTEDWYSALIGADPETTPEFTTEAPDVPTEPVQTEDTDAPTEPADIVTDAPAPATDPATEAPAPENKGCGGSVAGIAVVIAMLGGALVIKKKD